MTTAIDRPRAATTAPPRTRRPLALVLLGLGAGVAAASVLGPLALGVIDYHVGDDVLNQVVGGDAVALVLVAPAALAAAVLTWRRHSVGPVLALAPSAFAMYVYTQLAVGGEFTVEPGNSERFFPLFLGVFLLAATAFGLAWRTVGAITLPEPTTAMRRTSATVLVLLAVFLTVGLHLRGLVDVLDGPPYGVEYTQGPAVFWIVKWMDLGIVVPVAVLTAVGILRRAGWATRAMYAVIGWGALLGCAVAAMGVVMVARDDPAASPAAAGGFVVFAVAFGVLDGWLLRPLVTTRPQTRHQL